MLSFFLDPWYFIVVGPFMLLAMWAGSRVKGTFRKHNQQPIRSGFTGADAAQAIMRAAGVHDVKLEEVPGMLSDHYDPHAKAVRLSSEVLRGRTPAAVAVAAHEVGHVLQDAADYKPMRARAALVPVVNIGSGIAPWLFLIGLFVNPVIAWVGVALFGGVVLFHLVTLPVEYDASFRAMRLLEQSGIVAADEMPGVRKTLYAAGFTYVAAALMALAQVMYFVMILTGANRDE